ncbi:hypothetical protein SLS53_009143 [Cytospora paraplurivora]|uniref:C2 NT-type domain-containing protein n=1 Tax=Cytospora paraplurivora TaxID=2898453 RepID=A0AAN9TVV8_9PEZI
MAWTNVKKLPLVNKARKPRFEVHLRIYDLNNVPLVQGGSFIKWHLPHSIHGEHRGRTARYPVVNHRVEYGYGKIISVRIAIDKNNNLSECPIEFEVVQEFATHGAAAGREEKITLGKVTLNLSEYVEESEAVIRSTGFRTRSRVPSSSAAAGTGHAGGTSSSQGHTRQRSSLSAHAPTITSETLDPTNSHASSKSDNNENNNSSSSRAPSINEPAAQHQPEQHVEEGVIRRYLMQDSKINSTLKIGILMVQVDGERNFSAPALKTAPVFGGIAGMVGSDANASIIAADPTAAEFGHHLLHDEAHGSPRDTNNSNDILGGVASLNAQLSGAGKVRDVYELQDMYRRALAASWACQPGELPADECIEDIFSGGDGFGPDGPGGIAGFGSVGANAVPRGHYRNRSSRQSFSRSIGRFRGNDGGGGGAGGEEELHLRPNDRRGLGGRGRHARQTSGESFMTMRGRGGGGEGGGHQNQGGYRGGGGHRRDMSKDSGRPPLDRTESMSSLAATIEMERGRSGYKNTKEVDEYSIRDDLVAWALPESVS